MEKELVMTIEQAEAHLNYCEAVIRTDRMKAHNGTDAARQAELEQHRILVAVGCYDTIAWHDKGVLIPQDGRTEIVVTNWEV